MAVDGYDVAAVAGLVMLGAGLAMFSVSLALCVVGAVLLAGGLMGAWWKGRR